MKKSPVSRSQQKKNPHPSGIGRLPNGEPFVSMWPSQEMVIDLTHVKSKSVEEASDWAAKDWWGPNMAWIGPT